MISPFPDYYNLHRDKTCRVFVTVIKIVFFFNVFLFKIYKNIFYFIFNIAYKNI
jgi:hypothetical protein